MRRSCKIDPAETAGSLHDKLATLNADSLDEVVGISPVCCQRQNHKMTAKRLCRKNYPQEARLIGPVILHA